MAQLTQQIQRTLNVNSTGPTVFPSRLANMSLDLTTNYSQVIMGQLRMSTQSSATINFQGMTVAQLMVLSADTRLKIRQNGNSPVALGLTSSFAAARLALWEGSTTSLVVSNPSTAFIGNLQYVLAGR